MRKLVVLLAVLSSCRKGVDAAACRTQASELATLLRKADRGPSPLMLGKLELVKRPELPDVTAQLAPTMTLERGKLILDMRPVESPAELTRTLRDLKELLPARDLVNLAIARPVTWQDVTIATAAVHEAGFTRVGFVFGLPDRVSAPPRTPIDEELDALLDGDPSDRATGFARLAQKVVSPCKPLNAVFANVAVGPPEDKAKNIIDGLERALPECECKLDVPALRSVMFRLLSDPNPATVVVKNLAPHGRVLAEAATTEWKDAAPKLTEGEEGVWLSVQ